MYQGSIVALITPMQNSLEVDVGKLSELIEFQILNGTSAIVVNGTTGEFSTVEDEEQSKIVELAVKASSGRIPIIASTGTNSTKSTIEKTKRVKELGADACLVVAPYYNRPTQDGLFQHFTNVAEVGLPVILYNNPKRSACDLLPNLVAKLSANKNIIGIKESSIDPTRCQDLIRLCDKDFALLSGEDSNSYDFIVQGGHGVISVTANIAPKLMSDLVKSLSNGNIDLAKDINAKLIPLYNALGIESNPIPVKWALYEMGLVGKGIRLPLTQLSLENQKVLSQALKDVGVIS